MEHNLTASFRFTTWPTLSSHFPFSLFSESESLFFETIYRSNWIWLGMMQIIIFLTLSKSNIPPQTKLQLLSPFRLKFVSQVLFPKTCLLNSLSVRNTFIHVTMQRVRSREKSDSKGIPFKCLSVCFKTVLIWCCCLRMLKTNEPLSVLVSEKGTFNTDRFYYWRVVFYFLMSDWKRWVMGRVFTVKWAQNLQIPPLIFGWTSAWIHASIENVCVCY